MTKKLIDAEVLLEWINRPGCTIYDSKEWNGILKYNKFLIQKINELATQSHFISQYHDCEINHIPHEPPYEWDYLKAFTALKKGEVEYIECDLYNDRFIGIYFNDFMWGDKKTGAFFTTAVRNELNTKDSIFQITGNARKAKFRPYTPKK